MSAKVSSKPVAVDRCELCGYRFDGSFADRTGHLRRSHPRYTRGLLLRLLSPLVFLVAMPVLSLAHASQTAYLVALFGSFGLLFFGKQVSRSERSGAGARPTIGLRRYAREGGLWFVLVVPVVIALLLLLGKM